MLPILVAMYVLLAKRGERDAEDEVGDAWHAYAGRTPRFIPRLGQSTPTHREADSA